MALATSADDTKLMSMRWRNFEAILCESVRRNSCCGYRSKPIELYKLCNVRH